MDSQPFLWTPSASFVETAYVTKLMKKLGVATRDELWKYSVSNVSGFWDAIMKDMAIEWYRPYTQTVDTSGGIEWTEWFKDGETNLVHNCLDRHAKTRPAASALIWEGDDGVTRELTYQDFFTLTNQTANALKALGVQPGESVGILMPMVPEVVVQLFACFKIGAVAIPIFSGFGVDAIAGRLRDSGARVLFTSNVAFRRGKRIEVKKIADDAAKSVPNLKSVIVFERSEDAYPKVDKRDLSWKEFVLGQPKECETAHCAAEAHALILFTSGTTGNPKGVIHTHAGCLAQIGKELRYAFNVDEKTRFFWFTDIGWMMGPWEMIGVTLFGGTLLLYEGAPDFPTPARLWEILERHRVNVLGISPTAIRLLMRSGADIPEKFALKDLKILGSTGEPWDPESYAWLFKHVGKSRCPIINISGGTEIIGCILSPLPIDKLKSCSLGGPGLGVDADVFDESGKPIRGGIGHLVIKQPIPSMTKGFLNSKQRYLDTYFSKWKGVWYHGDWARVDDDGQWFLHGRSDDTIKIGGKRIGPVEFEAALMRDARVAEVATVGVPDSLKGESAVCFVVLKSQFAPGEEIRAELQALAAGSLGKALAPKEIRFSASLPKTRSAKIVRGMIRKIYMNEALGDTSSVENVDSLDDIRSAK